MMRKKYHKKDLRVERTEKLILDALIQCTIQKGFSAITVSDITESANINRATFYRHYKDKYDLLNQYTQKVFEMLNDQPLGKFRNSEISQNHHVPDSLIQIFEHVRENAAFYRVMWGKQGDADFAEKIRFYIQKRIRLSLPKNLPLDEQQINLFISYSASASFGAVLWWLEHDMPLSSEEMIQFLQRLESGNLKSLLERAS